MWLRLTTLQDELKIALSEIAENCGDSSQDEQVQKAVEGGVMEGCRPCSHQSLRTLDRCLLKTLYVEVPLYDGYMDIWI